MGILQGKRALIRIVRTPTEGVLVDPTGKRAGRGAYLCHRATCWDKALTSHALARALHVALTADDLAALRAYAASQVSFDEAVESKVV